MMWVPMLSRESLRVRLRLGEAAPPATTTRHQPAVRRAARLGQPPAVCHVGQGSPHGVKTSNSRPSSRGAFQRLDQVRNETNRTVSGPARTLAAKVPRNARRSIATSRLTVLSRTAGQAASGTTLDQRGERVDYGLRLCSSRVCQPSTIWSPPPVVVLDLAL